MEELLEFLKIIIPAGLVLYAMYLMVKSFLNKELEKKMLEVRERSVETVLPSRLQAYERMCLFLERIKADSLMIRTNKANFTAKEFQHILLHEIREEYNHNASQQIYMSEEVWNMIVLAKEDLVAVINESASQLDDEATSLALSRKVIEAVSNRPDNINNALSQLKNEISQTF